MHYWAAGFKHYWTAGAKAGANAGAKAGANAGAQAGVQIFVHDHNGLKQVKKVTDQDAGLLSCLHLQYSDYGRNSIGCYSWY
jgi:hypothetical protein